MKRIKVGTKVVINSGQVYTTLEIIPKKLKAKHFVRGESPMFACEPIEGFWPFFNATIVNSYHSRKEDILYYLVKIGKCEYIVGSEGVQVRDKKGDKKCK